MRGRLMSLPLVKNASVRKFFPNRLVIEITERQPFGLWQKDGVVKIIAADGAPIDELRDAKFANLPFVVGEAPISASTNSSICSMKRRFA